MRQVIKWARKCSECGSGMNEGYLVGGGDAYYCSDECLHKHFTPEEWSQECMVYDERYDDADEGLDGMIVGDESYWTDWVMEDVVEDDDVEWVEVDGVMIAKEDYPDYKPYED